MTHSFARSTLLLFFAAIVFLLTACNNNAADEKSSDKKDTTETAKNSSQVNLPTAGLTGGKLDTLFTDSASFVNLPANKKVVFVFTFRSNDTLTLHGWAAEKDTIFNIDPEIKLMKYTPSNISYGEGMYFGNVILKKGEIKAVKKLLDSEHAHTVLFAPKLVDVTHIGYDIFISKERPGLDKILSVITTGAGANPSPPKNY
jgi:hypothetical protein